MLSPPIPRTAPPVSPTINSSRNLNQNTYKWLDVNVNKPLTKLPFLTLTNHWNLMDFFQHVRFFYVSNINGTVNIVNYMPEKRVFITQSTSTALAAIELNNH